MREIASTFLFILPGFYLIENSHVKGRWSVMRVNFLSYRWGRKCLTAQTIASNSLSIVEYFISAAHKVRDAKLIEKSLPVVP